jgi:hypothetical protein
MLAWQRPQQSHTHGVVRCRSPRVGIGPTNGLPPVCRLLAFFPSLMLVATGVRKNPLQAAVPDGLYVGLLLGLLLGMTLGCFFGLVLHLGRGTGREYE